MPTLVERDNPARASVSGRPGYGLAATRRGRRVPSDQSREQLFLHAPRGARSAPSRRHSRSALRRVPRLGARQDHPLGGRGNRFDLLALYGWAVDLLALTLVPGTVNRARLET